MHPEVVSLRIVTDLLLLMNLRRLLYSSCYDLGAGSYYEFSVAQFLSQRGAILSFVVLLLSPILLTKLASLKWTSVQANKCDGC